MAYIFSVVPFSRTFVFTNLPITWPKVVSPPLSNTVNLPLISWTNRFLKPIFVSLGGWKIRDSKVSIIFIAVWNLFSLSIGFGSAYFAFGLPWVFDSEQHQVCIRAKWFIRPEFIPVSVTWSDQECFYSPVGGMLVHRRVTPSIKLADTYLYTWVERSTVRVKCLAQEHHTVSPSTARTRTARSGVECTNLEATAPPTRLAVYWKFYFRVIVSLFLM